MGPLREAGRRTVRVSDGRPRLQFPPSDGAPGGPRSGLAGREFWEGIERGEWAWGREGGGWGGHCLSTLKPSEKSQNCQQEPHFSFFVVFFVENIRLKWLYFYFFYI